MNVKFAIPAKALLSLNCTYVLLPAAFVEKTYGDPLAYNKLFVFKFPALTFAVNVPKSVVISPLLK